MKTVTLKKGKENSLLRRHLWVFSGAIDRISAKAENGELVSIEDSRGQFIGIGHWHDGSISVRVLTFEKVRIDAEFWEKRILDAYELRCSIGLPNEQTNCFRLIHGEGDGLPGCIIDVYADGAVIQSHTTGMALCAKDIAEAVRTLKELNIKTIFHQNLAEKTEEFLLGTSHAADVWENGLEFRVNWVKGQKTGFFLDQRDNRSLVGEFANGKNVLNTFCYTGGFSIYALAKGAAKVTSVDVSQNAVNLAAENAKINNLDKHHEAICMDAFKFLENAKGYDLVILDPPAFAKSIKARHRAVQGYKRLNETALRNIAPNSLLFTFSCSQVVSPELFEHTVLAAAINANRQVRVLKRLGHQMDHPVNIFHPEGEYLKGLMLYVS